MASRIFGYRIGEEHEVKKAKLPLKPGSEGSNVEMPREITEEQEEDKKLKTSTSRALEIIPSPSLKALHITSYLLLERISHPELFLKQFNSLKNQLSHFRYCPMPHWEKDKLELEKCLSNIEEQTDLLNLQVIINNVKRLICTKSKRRSCRQLALEETDIKMEIAQQTFPLFCKVVKTKKGVVMHSLEKMMISCYDGDQCCQSIKCCSVVTDLTRVETEDKVMATMPGLKKLLIVGCRGTQLLKMGKGYRLISHVGGSTFVGCFLHSRSLQVVDWKLKGGMIEEFEMKDYPSDLAVGPREHILTSFAYLNCVVCYTVKGEVLFEVNSVSRLPLNMPSRIFADRRYFYFLESEGKRINRVSALGGVSQVKIPIAANNVAIEKNGMILWKSFGQSFIVETGQHFWPKEKYCHKAKRPTIDRYVDLNNAIEVKDIVMVSQSRVILTYWDRKIVLIDVDNIDHSFVDSVDLEWVPTSLCRWNQAEIVVSFSAVKRIEFLCWEGDEFERICELETLVGYEQLSNKGSNSVVGLTVKPQAEIHMIVAGDDKRVTVIAAVIKLEHGNVTIAASRFNLLVGDIDKCKLVFFSFSGKQLAEKKLKVRPGLVSSNGSHFYVVSANRQSVVDCYSIGGHFEGEFEVISHCLPQLGACNGTLCVVDTAYSRVVLYRHDNWDSCEVEVKSDSDSWSLDIRYGERLEKKVMVGAMCLLVDGDMVIADWGSEIQLLVISQNGDVVKRHPLPSLATAICRWGLSEFGVILPLEKELWLFNCISFDECIQIISLAKPYIRVCQFDDTRAVCYCDRPSCLDVVTVKGPAQGAVVTYITANPDYIKSIAVRPDTKDILTWDSRRLLSYNITNNITTTTNISPKKNTFFQVSQSWLGLGLGLELQLADGCYRKYTMSCNITDIPWKATLFEQRQSLLGGGCTDETLLYVIDKRRLFSVTIVEDSEAIGRYFSGYKVGATEQVDVLSGCICGSELLSSTVHLQDLTVTERGIEYFCPRSREDKEVIRISDVAITDNNLIAVCDRGNRNLKIVSFKGRLLGTLPLAASPRGVCQWAPNTLLVTLDDKKTLLTVKVQFPLSYKKHKTRRPYKYIAALSDGRLVCSWELDYPNDGRGLDLVNIEKDTRHCIVEMESDIRGVAVIPKDIIAVASYRYSKSRVCFFSCSGESLYEVDLFSSQIYKPFGGITSDGTDLYVTGELALGCPSCVVCLSRRGEYKRVFRHHTLKNSERHFWAIDCRGARIVVVSTNRSLETDDSLYVQGLTVGREALPVSRLSPVKIQELDVSAEGDTIICDTENQFVRLLKFDGQVICEKSLPAGGVCFMGGERRAALVTLPHSSQLFALDVGNLDIVERWNTKVPYGRIRRLEQNLCFLCFHINGTHKVKVVGDTLEIMRETGSKPGSDSTGTPKLWATCGNYVASSRVGSARISGRQLPSRTSQFLLPVELHYPFSSRVHAALLTDDTIVISDGDSKTITLTTFKGHLVKQMTTATPPCDVCQWTDDTFVVTFPDSEEVVFFNKALSRTKTIPTEKRYRFVCKNQENQLICGSRREEYFESGERKYLGASIDILSATDGSVICSTAVTDGRILDIGVTHSSVVSLLNPFEKHEKGKKYTRPVLCWYTGQGLHQYKTFRPEVAHPKQIAIHGRDVYLLAGEEQIYRISPTDTCELYLNRDQTDCVWIRSIDISNSHLIITGSITGKSQGVRVYDVNCPLERGQ